MICDRFLNVVLDLRVFAPCDKSFADSLAECKTQIEAQANRIQRLKLRIQKLQYRLTGEVFVQQDHVNLEGQLQDTQDELREAKAAESEWQNSLSQSSIPTEHRQCGFVYRSSGLSGTTIQGGSRDWAVLEPIDAAWPLKPNTVRNFSSCLYTR
jgi:hypothetical protein